MLTSTKNCLIRITLNYIRCLIGTAEMLLDRTLFSPTISSNREGMHIKYEMLLSFRTTAHVQII